MAKKKKTLAQQYDEQVRRIEKRLQQLADEGYDIVSEWDSTYRPKRATKKQVDALKQVTPAYAKYLRIQCSPTYAKYMRTQCPEQNELCTQPLRVHPASRSTPSLSQYTQHHMQRQTQTTQILYITRYPPTLKLSHNFHKTITQFSHKAVII